MRSCHDEHIVSPERWMGMQEGMTYKLKQTTVKENNDINELNPCALCNVDLHTNHLQWAQSLVLWSCWYGKKKSLHFRLNGRRVDKRRSRNKGKGSSKISNS